MCYTAVSFRCSPLRAGQRSLHDFLFRSGDGRRPSSLLRKHCRLSHNRYLRKSGNKPRNLLYVQSIPRYCRYMYTCRLWKLSFEYHFKQTYRWSRSATCFFRGSEKNLMDAPTSTHGRILVCLNQCKTHTAVSSNDPRTDRRIFRSQPCKRIRQPVIIS